MHLFTQLCVFSKKNILFAGLLGIQYQYVLAKTAQTGDAPYIASPVTLIIKNPDLHQAFSQLNGQAGYSYVYDNGRAKNIKLKDLNYKKVALSRVLKSLQNEVPFSLTVDGASIMVRIEDVKPAVRVKNGIVSGKIVDEKGEPLPGATVKVIETGLGTQTNVDGQYTLSMLPGIYTIEITYISFQTQRVSGVRVTEGQLTPLNVSLKAAAGSLQEVLVTASYQRASIEGLYAKQKNNAAMSDGITAEQISRTPDNNTAQVLKRVSGLQVSQNKYVVVRGLSDRYNNVLLNDNQLPSSEPNRRDFAFDMVPSALVDNIVVNKTATPDLPGEFTGGLVQITTKDIPEEDFINVTIGQGFNSQATGKDFIGGYRGSANYLGFTNKYQKQPEGMSFGEYNVLANKIAGNQASAAEKSAAANFLGSFPDNWKMQRYKAQPIQNYAFSMGKTIPLKDDRIGFVAALTYRNEQTADVDDQYYPTVLDYKGTDYDFTTLLGGSANIGYTSGTNKWVIKNTYNRRFTDKLFRFSGIDFMSSNARMNGYTAQTLLNELFQSSLHGEHALGKRVVKLDYNFGISTINRDQPNNRIMSMRGLPVTSPGPDNYFEYNFNDFQPEYGSVFYTKLNETRFTYQANVQVPFKWLKRNQSFKIGYQGNYRKADYHADLYRIKNVPGADNQFNGLAYDRVYNNQNLIVQKLFFVPFIGNGKQSENGSASGYNGNQHLNAYYAMVDVAPVKHLRITGGIRLEQNTQRVNTNTLGAVTDPNEVRPIVDSLITLKKNDWLPSVNVIYALTPKMNIRSAFYKTVARPDLRELSFFEYFDIGTFRNITGNGLKSTDIRNFDLRYEFFPSPDELISVSGFYKEFKNPIELTFENTSSKPQLIYRNLAAAKDIGFEVDLRKSLGLVNPETAFWKKLYLSGSFTWVHATVELDRAAAVDGDGNPISTKRNRPLYGQSPYIINGGISYTGKYIGVNATYNRYGKRIVTSTISTAEDEYENPRDVVDLQFSYRFLKQQRAELRLNISDLLNQQLITYKNQYGPGNATYPERTPSVKPYPGDGTAEYPAEQLDPKGTAYNAPYDVVTFRRKNGTNYVLNFIYRF
ncbi:TonB-dependent receptor [Mucilaginibacter sp. UR6-1]|uniref:TonB-dependent receptor n=1 Tax=Mucilaginibacter sp. UR6-1 TaxID=1435643 RepID=UPI001E4C3598|nr:TonB-dependent receptor [Mucilaginibacter sp. UR6-1]MCC8407818.1 TonB-dependent receptor [Mucilaginibacter sp. UR6-1]